MTPRGLRVALWMAGVLAALAGSPEVRAGPSWAGSAQAKRGALPWEPGQAAAPLYNRAVLAFEEGRFDDVYAFVATMERRGIGCGRARLVAAAARLREGDARSAAEARSALQELSLLFPAQREVWLHLSDASFVAGDPAASAAEARAALDRGGGVEAVEAEIRGWRGVGDLGGAGAAIEAGRARGVDEGALACLEVTLLAWRGARTEAWLRLEDCPVGGPGALVRLRLEAEAAVATDPGRRRDLAWVMGEPGWAAALAAAARWPDDPAGCVAGLAPVIAADPRDPWLRLLRARCRASLGQPDAAAQDLAVALAAAPGVRAGPDGRLSGTLTAEDRERLRAAIREAAALSVDVELSRGGAGDPGAALIRLEGIAADDPEALPSVYVARARIAGASGGSPLAEIAAGLAILPGDLALTDEARRWVAAQADARPLPPEIVAALRGGGGWIDAWNLARWHLAAQDAAACLDDLSPDLAVPPEAAPRLRGLAYTCAAISGDLAALDRLLSAGGPAGLDPAALLQHAWLMRGRDRGAAAAQASIACQGPLSAGLREQCRRVQGGL